MMEKHCIHIIYCPPTEARPHHNEITYPPQASPTSSPPLPLAGAVRNSHLVVKKILFFFCLDNVMIKNCNSAQFDVSQWNV